MAIGIRILDPNERAPCRPVYYFSLFICTLYPLDAMIMRMNERTRYCVCSLDSEQTEDEEKVS